jgi:hypothetical protein
VTGETTCSIGEPSREPGLDVEDVLDGVVDGVLELEVEGVLDAALELEVEAALDAALELEVKEVLDVAPGLDAGRALGATVERGLTVGSMTREYLGAAFRKEVTTDLPEPAPW